MTRNVSWSPGRAHSVRTADRTLFGVPHKNAPNKVEDSQGKNMEFLVCAACISPVY